MINSYFIFKPKQLNIGIVIYLVLPDLMETIGSHVLAASVHSNILIALK